MYESCPTLQIFIAKQGHQHNVCMQNVFVCLYTPPSDGNIYK
jgi:hypothetical protein